MRRPDPRYTQNERTDARYLERWWHHARDSERFWLEATDRDDIGTTLEGSCFDSSDGRRNPAYLLAIREVEIGDVVVHLDLDAAAIVKCSRVATWPDDADGDYEWRCELSDTHVVGPAVGLDEVRQRATEIRTVVSALPKTQRAGNPHHLAFEWRGSSLGLHQGAYLTKLPAAFVNLFPQLRATAQAVLS
jgi:hypothetical protein